MWAFAAGVVAVYAALFLFARRPVGVRLERVRWVIAGVVAVRLVLAVAGYAMEPHAVFLSLIAVLVLLTQRFHRPDRLWLVRATGDEVNEKILAACRRLFLECTMESPHCYSLISRNAMGEIRVRQLAPRTQMLTIRGGSQGKISLLLNWLGKQYPGPWPRVRIVLKRSHP